MLMENSNVPELAVVKLKDGREATVQVVYTPTAFLAEIYPTNELIDVHIQDIESVIWAPKNKKPYA